METEICQRGQGTHKLRTADLRQVSLVVKGGNKTPSLSLVYKEIKSPTFFFMSSTFNFPIIEEVGLSGITCQLWRHVSGDWGVGGAKV